ncbi:unnamed protein product [Blepharisma stoltei]|uniref:ABC transporter domain-containing protein n=1 Tax=Blepharisma stoltei TaxID=1481888 RepID=A0AAU9JRQ4_9CILI|nr:unnamed protein product [Blepharisma stoltei]
MGSSGSGKTILFIFNYNTFNTSLFYYYEIISCQLIIRFFNGYLLFYAMLRFPGSIEEKSLKVQEILDDLNISNIADNLIGNEIIKGLSGGEKKRLSIGMELITDPCILMLDEPTSGLDSYNAELVIDLLIKQALKGRTIISTIHQPSSSIFKKFDKLILLLEGNIIYQGSCKNSRKYFAELGYKCPKSVNPADFYMRIFHVSNRFDITENEQEMMNLLFTAYREKYHKERQSSEYELSELHNIKVYYPGIWAEFYELLKRAAKNASRNKLSLKLRLASHLGFSVIVALFFNDLGDNVKSIQNRNGLIYLLVMFAVVQGNGTTVNNFPLERAPYIKERSQGLYGTIPYFLAKNIADLPWTFIIAIMTAVIVYFSAGLNNNDGSKFIIFYIIYSLLLQCGVGLGCIIGAIFSRSENAMAFSSILVLPLVAFGGEYVKLDNIPISFRWISYITPFKWGFQALAANEYNDLDLSCEPSCDPLGSLGFSHEIWEGVVGVIAISTCTRIISFIILKLMTKTKLG